MASVLFAVLLIGVTIGTFLYGVAVGWGMHRTSDCVHRRLERRLREAEAAVSNDRPLCVCHHLAAEHSGSGYSTGLSNGRGCDWCECAYYAPDYTQGEASPR